MSGADGVVGGRGGTGSAVPSGVAGGAYGWCVDDELEEAVLRRLAKGRASIAEVISAVKLSPRHTLTLLIQMENDGLVAEVGGEGRPAHEGPGYASVWSITAEGRTALD